MPSDALFEDTARGLCSRPKELPSLWLYDARGSKLYEQITQLADYYLPARERELLAAHATDIARRIPARTLVELGAGAPGNVRHLLDALTGLERFVPFDVSVSSLRANADEIAAFYPSLSVEPLAGDFERDLDRLAGPGPKLVALLGSTLGNLVPKRRHRFLARLVARLDPDDALLLGLDLVKDPARITAAYNDSGGVTEAFVRNAPTAVNRELGGNFDQDALEYEAIWDADREWMDIGFRALERHPVSVDALGLVVIFEPGERLRVEISAKFRREGIFEEARRAGLRVDEWWTDPAQDFAVALLSSS
jgi:L-histidine Nalpha-methyltransferase